MGPEVVFFADECVFSRLQVQNFPCGQLFAAYAACEAPQVVDLVAGFPDKVLVVDGFSASTTLGPKAPETTISSF